MAHFAQLNAENKVINVIVINNEVILDENNVEQEQKGIDFCKSIFGQDTVWVQTSYNKNFRKNYAGLEYKYDAELDAFIPPQFYASWILDENAQWKAPVPYPTDKKRYLWDETTTSWVLDKRFNNFTI